MVQFEFQPWKRIIVHEVVKYPLEDFISRHSLGVEAGQIGRPIMWVDGIIYEIGHFRDTDEITKEKLQGTIHWSFLHYGELEKFKPEFKVAGNISIPVIDVSDNQIFKDMADWIKKNFPTSKAFGREDDIPGISGIS